MKKGAKQKRSSWDEYFLKMVDIVGSRGTCDRGRSGAILVKEKRILATGYVGSPVGIAHCDDVGHEMHTLTRENGTISRHCLRTAHAELNAIANAARFGVAINESTLYCKMVPCYTCAKTIINAGIKRVVALKDYHATKQSKIVFKKAGVKLEIINKNIESYKDQ
ncbi:cell division protein DedD [Candidatus Nomurabacteria bacterium RIFCSPHIGHO2_01_FULL_43_16]|nr:MAG: cell division protein DedD [Candidatus Nomurabacteria bacterium RIFCSPHIGHO2_01_FULL_43_16]OGI97185.1 MAG: cell division protein DedD [Candidatus Nomurabacteria bacterium RIFCSPLOWO2_01_FULL_43_15]